MVYCLAPFVGTGAPGEDPFRVDGAASIIDLRADETQGGWALTSAPVLPAGAVNLGDTLDTAPNRPTTRDVETKLGLARDVLAGLTVRRIVEDVLIVHGDDADPGRWNAAKPERDNHYRLWLDGLVSEMAVQSGGATFTDNFDRADSTNLGADWDEIAVDAGSDHAISTNRLRHNTGGGAEGYVRMVNPLDTDNHHALVTLADQPSGTGYFGPTVRMSTADRTFYLGYRRETVGVVDLRDKFHISKWVAGTETILVSEGAASTQPAMPYTFDLTADGSTLTLAINGVDTLTVTDTSITGNLRAGVWSLITTAGTRVVDWDDFTAADLSAAAPQTVTVGAASEVETAQPVSVGSAITVAVTAATETETAQTVAVSTGAVTIPVGAASETETAQPATVVSAVAVAVGTAAETETAVAVGAVAGAVTVAVGTTSETESVQPVAATLGPATVAVGTVTEAETAQTVTVDAGAQPQTITVGTTAETETAQPVTVEAAGAAQNIVVGTVTETESAQPVAVTAGATSVAVATVVETETVQPIAAVQGGSPQNVPVGTVTEVETVLSVGPIAVMALLVGLATETETAQPVTPSTTVGVWGPVWSTIWGGPFVAPVRVTVREPSTSATVREPAGPTVRDRIATTTVTEPSGPSVREPAYAATVRE